MEREEIALIGRITAGVTHEMRNALAVIRESNGLMRDLLMRGKDGSGTQGEKFGRAISMIEKHLLRGIEMTDRLNRFAHTMDEEAAWTEVNGVLDLTLFFMERFARERLVRLAARRADEDLSLYTSPLRLMLALCACVDYLLARTAEGGLIELQGQRAGEQVFFRLRVQQDPGGHANSGAAGEGAAVIDPVLRALQGRLGPVLSGASAGVELVVPVGDPER